MAQKWTTYRSTARVKARKVTAKAGERIVTTDGPQEVAYGDYVILTGSDDAPQTSSLNADEFESGWGKVGGKKARKTSATPTSKEAPPVVAGVKDDASTPDAKATAAARVKAAREAKAAAKKSTPAPAKKTTPARR